MIRKALNILIILFSCLQLQAQAGADGVYSKVSSYKVLDVKRGTMAAIDNDNNRFSLFVFLSPECPLCQNYTKTLNGITERYGQKIEVTGIVPGDAYTAKEVADFGKKYQVSYKLYIDTDQKLTHYLGATITPQVILLNNKGQLVYSGAIDNWIVSLGKKRLNVTQHYLADAIDQSLRRAPVAIKRTDAIGCKINDI